MSLRLPQTLDPSFRRETGEGVLHAELLAEQAYSLGRAGRRVEEALAALAAQESEDGRAEALRAAADAVWAFLVQRELMGLRDSAAMVAQYGVPRQVLNRLGVK
jgi:hypothetical protein